MVEIFKTNVDDHFLGTALITVIVKQFPDYVVNFDLSDCDKILRVEATEIDQEKILAIVWEQGYECLVLS